MCAGVHVLGCVLVEVSAVIIPQSLSNWFFFFFETVSLAWSSSSKLGQGVQNSLGLCLSRLGLPICATMCDLFLKCGFWRIGGAQVFMHVRKARYQLSHHPITKLPCL